MVHWPWLERQTRRHPALGLGLALALLGAGIVVLLTAWDEPGPRTGLPMGIVAVVAIVVFAVASAGWARRAARRRPKD